MKKRLFISISLLCLYALFTISLLFIDRAVIGPNGSMVGYATLNNWFHNLTGVNWLLYDLTDYGGIPPIIMGIGFGILGFIELAKRKSFIKVDFELIMLGILYLITFVIYLLFEFMVINYRPVFINGFLEASYPSSTTFLSITFMLSSIIPIKKYIKNVTLERILIFIAHAYMTFLVVGRVLSGVHWLTDIIGSLLLGFSLVKLYNYFVAKHNQSIILEKQIINHYIVISFKLLLLLLK